MLAMLRNIAMQHEVGEQGLQAHGAEAGHLPVSVDQAEIAEQADVKGWLHRDLLDSRFSNERTTRSFQPADAQRSHDQKAGGIGLAWRSPQCLMEVLIVDLVRPFTQALIELRERPDGLTFGINRFGQQARLL